MVTRLFWVLSILSGVMMVVMARCDLANNDSVFPYLYRCLMINQSLDLHAQVRQLAPFSTKKRGFNLSSYLFAFL